MIKIKILILLAFSSLSLVATTRTEILTRTQSTLLDDFNDFLELIPVSDMESVFLKYLANDSEMQHAMTYLQSDEFRRIVVFVDSQPVFQDLCKYLAAAGLDLDTWINNNLLWNGGFPPIIITKRASSRTLAEFWNQIKAMLPIDDLNALYAEKLECSPDFKTFIHKISSNNFHKMVRDIKALPAVKTLRQRLLELGIDVKEIERLVRDLFGW